MPKQLTQEMVSEAALAEAELACADGWRAVVMPRLDAW
jgi:hypothetical protein